METKLTMLSNTSQAIRDFQNWRKQLSFALPRRREALLDLIDALSSNHIATSAAELSLNPLFQRDYNSLYKGIADFLLSPDEENYSQEVKQIFQAVSGTIPTTNSRSFNLFGIDATPYPRPYSSTLADKTFIHYPNPIKGNKPINIGHSYSVVCALPERTETGNVSWAIPLSCERVISTDTTTKTGNKQLAKIWESSEMPDEKLSVLVADCDYSQRGFIGEQVQQENLVTITRVRSNRVFYRPFISENPQKKRVGHPRWYGDKFDLSNSETWHEPDEVTYTSLTTKRCRHLTVIISAWKQMLMRGTKTYKMNLYPFTLLQITVKDPTTNCTIWKPMWLIVIGECRHELSLIDCYESYRQRYDMEHLFRFCKQKLLMNSYFTPDVHHEENWVKLTLLVYVNLWAARKLATVLPRPWEQYLKPDKSVNITPSLVQRDFHRIIKAMGLSAKSPKRRGFSLGGIKGEKKDRRTRHQVIKKTQKSPGKNAKAS
jgi:hypothetical protein